MPYLPGYLLFLALLLLQHCDIPRDSADSMAQARADTLRVGVTESPPFVVLEGDRPRGIEISLVESFAATQGLEITYHKGSETELVKLLEDRKLHLVIGGFEKNSIWKSRAGLSTPYDSNHVLLVPKGENRLLFNLESSIYNRNP